MVNLLLKNLSMSGKFMWLAWEFFKAFKWVPLLAAGFVILLGIIAVSFFGSIPYAIAHMQGFTLYADMSQTDLGKVRVWEKRQVRFRLRNISLEPVTIIGVETTCGCTVLKDQLPLSIKPGNSYELTFTFSVSEKLAGKLFHTSARVFTNTSGPILTLVFSAQVEGVDQGKQIAPVKPSTTIAQ